MFGTIESKSRYLALQSRERPTMLARAQQAVVRLFDAIGDWQERERSRRFLGSLDERMLQDIGIDRATAEHEAASAFWRR